MTWGLVATAGAGLVGGMMSANAAENAAETQAGVSREQAAALQAAGRWKATGTTNRYGTSEQVLDPDSGALTSATWNMSPEMKAYQDRLQAGANTALPTDFDATQATQAQYQLLKNQQAPGVERQYSGLLSDLMHKGTLGLSTGGTSGIGGGPALAQVNPQMEAFMNAVAQQDAANLTGAQTQVRSMMDSDITRSNGLMGQVGNIEDRGRASLADTLKWSQDQREGALRGAGATAAQTNLAAQQIADADSGSMWGSLLSGLSSNPNTAKAVSGFFNTTASPVNEATRTGRLPGTW